MSDGPSLKPSNLAFEAVKIEVKDLDEVKVTIKQEEIDLFHCKSTIKQEDTFCNANDAHEKNSLRKIIEFCTRHDYNKFYCEKCNFSTSIAKESEEHKATHTFNENNILTVIYRCDVCPYESNHWKGFKQHQKTHSNKCYKCEICGFQTKVKIYLTKHQKQHLIPDNEQYECPTCGRQTVELWSFKNHLLTHKNPDEVFNYKCDVCQFRTRYKYHLTRHKQRHLSFDKGVTKADEVPMYKCDLCFFQTKFSIGLKRHQSIHRYKRDKSESCGFITKWTGDEERHLNTKEEAVDGCEGSDYQTKFKQYLNNTHTSVR